MTSVLRYELTAVCLIALFVLVQCRQKAVVEQPQSARHSESTTATKLEAKLAALESCGLALRPEFSIDDLLSSWGRAEYEAPGYDLPLTGLGMTQEKPPWKHHSDNVWHFDKERIEGHGAYVEIAKRMAEMAGGSLPLQDIKDYVDVEEGKAWLSFELGGETIRYDLKVNYDWVDPQVLSHFVGLLTKEDPSKIYFYYDLGGQNCILGCVGRSDFEKLRKLLPAVVPLT